ncbi:MAG: DUF1045 domain-containing protein [Desulfovibrionaceae bacterium]|jgi:putative phosphonate metabolism protein|nr:DUF1045 domain-containing protein [Desulfovibrionaceae bacterium]
MGPRYAVYYAPPRRSPLAVFGGRWLGYDVETGLDMVPLSVPGFSVAEVAHLTRSPRRYGFHATLKPPFALAPGKDEDALLDFAAFFTAGLQPFTLSGLEATEVGSFLALCTPVQHEAAHLAEQCLRAFEPFRAEPSIAETERRRARGLTPRQEQYLAQWGYPYVLREYLFHLTLTGTVPDRRLRRRLLKTLRELTAPLTGPDLLVRELCIFRQVDRDSPFVLARRLPFGGETWV